MSNKKCPMMDCKSPRLRVQLVGSQRDSKTYEVFPSRESQSGEKSCENESERKDHRASKTE